MCGIVGAVAQRDIADILLMGLQSLEYRGYDSAGVATVGPDGSLNRLRRVGKVKELYDAVEEFGMIGGTGIAHTRWATHGEPNEANAHPHVSADRISVVHNGIIENHAELDMILHLIPILRLLRILLIMSSKHQRVCLQLYKRQ